MIPLLFPIFNQIRKYILYEDVSPLYRAFTSSISYSLAGPIYLIVLYRSRKVQRSSTSENIEGKPLVINQIYLNNKNTIKQRRNKKLISAFLLSLINMIPVYAATLLLKQKLYKKLSKSAGVLSTVLFLVICSKIFLDSKILRHHVISLSIIIFCFIIFLIIDIIKITNDKPTIIVLIGNLLYYILVYGLYSFYDVLAKKHFKIHSNTPYHLMFFVGLFSLILLIPLNLFVFFYNDKDLFGLDIIKQTTNLFSLSFCFRFLFDIIIEFLCLWMLFHTIYYFSPCHFIICKALSEFLSKCIEWIGYINKDVDDDKKDELYLILIYVFFYVIIIFSSLVYNEVIIINLWGLEKNTFKYISFRQKNEYEDTQNKYKDNLDKRESTMSISSINEGEENEEIVEKKTLCYHQ